MDNVCKKCGKKIDTQDDYCGFCGAKSQENSKFLKRLGKITGIVLIAIIAFVIIYSQRFRVIGSHYLKKTVTPALEEKYKGKIEKIKYTEMKYCVEEYNTCAGDAGSGRKENKECKIYNYDVTLKDGTTSKAYLFDANGKIEVKDEFAYTKTADYLSKKQKTLKYDKLKMLYYDPYYIANNCDLEDKIIVIYYNKPIKDVLNQKFINQYVLLDKDINDYVQKQESDLKRVQVLVEFKDKMYIALNRDDSIEVVEIHDGYSPYTIEEYLEIYGISGYEIDIDADDDEINWCLSNDSYSYEYNHRNDESDS